MKITFIGATHEVTGSCYYLEAAGHKFLVDCGMEQGPDYYENAEIYNVLFRAFDPHTYPKNKMPDFCFANFHYIYYANQIGKYHTKK